MLQKAIREYMHRNNICRCSESEMVKAHPETLKDQGEFSNKCMANEWADGLSQELQAQSLTRS